MRRRFFETIRFYFLFVSEGMFVSPQNFVTLTRGTICDLSKRKYDTSLEMSFMKPLLIMRIFD